MRRLVVILLVTAGSLSLAACFGDAPPGTPSAVAGDTDATVSWSAPIGDTGALLTGYKVTPYLGTDLVPQTPVVFSSTATTQTISGLVNGSSYRFAVQAINPAGSASGGSVLSNAITPSGEATAVAGGGDHTCALMASGRVKCWGQNEMGQLGDGTRTASSVPVTVAGITNATAIAVGSMHSCAVLSDGTVRCWGLNTSLQLGTGFFAYSATPVKPSAISGAVSIAAGYDHTCALTTAGTIRCWGSNGSGQLGIEAPAPARPPVTGITNAVAVSAGLSYSCAQLADGTVRCWGSNDYAQLGGWGIDGGYTPVTIHDYTTAVSIGSSGSYSCTALASGSISCWGTWACFSEIDEGGLCFRNVTGATDVTVGGGHACAMIDGGTIECWGQSLENLGVEDPYAGAPDSWPPTVAGITSATSVSAGADHTCAVLEDGAIRCWGHNTWGKLGNGTASDALLPVAVVGL